MQKPFRARLRNAAPGWSLDSCRNQVSDRSSGLRCPEGTPTPTPIIWTRGSLYLPQRFLRTGLQLRTLQTLPSPKPRQFTAAASSWIL